MASKNFFSFQSINAQHNDEAGSLTCASSKETPGLVNISLVNLILKPNGSLEPIWHPNANKLGYCLQGKALASIRTPQGTEVFTVQKGEMFFIPQGFIHHLQNIGKEDCVIAFSLSSANPEVMHLSKAVNSISDSVFTATFGTPDKFVDALKKNKGEKLLKILPSINNAPTFIPSRFKFDIGASSKPILTRGGYLQIGIKPNLPILDKLGILGFGLTPKGVVEPHWHTNAGELVYIVKGQTRITVLAPDGTLDVMEVNGGEGAFAAASHFHNIENVGDSDVEVIAFFSDAEPNYIGIGEVVGAYSNDVLGSVFNLPADYFNNLKKPQGPLVIVPVA